MNTVPVVTQNFDMRLFIINIFFFLFSVAEVEELFFAFYLRENIEKRRVARLAGKENRYNASSRRNRALFGGDKEGHATRLAGDVEGHFNAN